MKISKISLIILLTASTSTTFAFSRPPVTSDTCPAEDTITRIDSTYTAPGGWTGVVQQNKPGKVKVFEMALYKPKDTEHPFQEGRLLRCVYKLENGNSLDLRLPTLKPGSDTEPGDKASITNSKNWQAAYGGNQYDCSESRLACEFHLSK